MKKTVQEDSFISYSELFEAEKTCHFEVHFEKILKCDEDVRNLERISIPLSTTLKSSMFIAICSVTEENNFFKSCEGLESGFRNMPLFYVHRHGSLMLMVKSCISCDFPS
ncbi:hypothetical protein C0J52_26909 [Blattella germanica]|nr:hypothetical protein C0J52_26909 [Blattella germanica]